MSTYRVHKGKENPYVMLDKTSVNDSSLSWKAKGILVYLLSKPDDWRVIESDIVKHARDGRDSVRAGLRELERAGYIVRAQEHGQDGKFQMVSYEVYERPQLVSQYLVVLEKPSTENPSTVKTRVMSASISKDKEPWLDHPQWNAAIRASEIERKEEAECQ